MPLLEQQYITTITRNLGRKEAAILFRFVDGNQLVGDFYTRVPICGKHFRIDAMCVEGQKTQYPISVFGKLDELRDQLLRMRGRCAWVLEIKETLNCEVLGQIVADMYYFPAEYPNINVKGYGILCEKNDETLAAVCKKHNIKVFETRA